MAIYRTQIQGFSGWSQREALLSMFSPGQSGVRALSVSERVSQFGPLPRGGLSLNRWRLACHSQSYLMYKIGKQCGCCYLMQQRTYTTIQCAKWNRQICLEFKKAHSSDNCHILSWAYFVIKLGPRCAFDCDHRRARAVIHAFRTFSCAAGLKKKKPNLQKPSPQPYLKPKIVPSSPFIPILII